MSVSTARSTVLSPATDRIVRVLLVLLAIFPAVGQARAFLEMFGLPGDLDPWTDAWTYLAAGERLNAGHSLYGALVAGDRPVLVDPDFFYNGVRTALLSPPTIAAIWRPIAAVPFGFDLWIVAVWVAMLGAVAWLVYRAGIVGLLVAFALQEPIGNQLAIANVTAFFPLLLLVIWVHRRKPWIGAVVGLMAAIKIAPAAMFGWSRIIRSPRALIWAGGSLVAIGAVVAVTVGIGAIGDYLRLAPSFRPSTLSLTGITGLPWLTFGVLIAGTLAAALIRNDAISYIVAVATLVAGTPSLYHAGLVPLLAVAAPLMDTADSPLAWPRRLSPGQAAAPQPVAVSAQAVGS